MPRSRAPSVSPQNFPKSRQGAQNAKSAPVYRSPIDIHPKTISRNTLRILTPETYVSPTTTKTEDVSQIFAQLYYLTFSRLQRLNCAARNRILRCAPHGLRCPLRWAAIDSDSKSAPAQRVSLFSFESSSSTTGHYFSSSSIAARLGIFGPHLGLHAWALPSMALRGNGRSLRFQTKASHVLAHALFSHPVYVAGITVFVLEPLVITSFFVIEPSAIWPRSVANASCSYRHYTVSTPSR